MSTSVSVKKLEEQLKDAGKDLLSPPSSFSDLLSFLDVMTHFPSFSLFYVICASMIHLLGLLVLVNLFECWMNTDKKWNAHHFCVHHWLATFTWVFHLPSWYFKLFLSQCGSNDKPLNGMIRGSKWKMQRIWFLLWIYFAWKRNEKRKIFWLFGLWSHLAIWPFGFSWLLLYFGASFWWLKFHIHV